jgi:hypothetical protein
MSDKRAFEDKSVMSLIQPPELFNLRQLIGEVQELLISGRPPRDAVDRLRQAWQRLNVAQRSLAQQGVKADYEGMCKSLNQAQGLIAEVIVSEDPLHRAQVRS